MKRCMLVGMLLAATCVSQAFEAKQVFREERFTRGNVNLRVIQAADAADWIWIADGGPAKVWISESHSHLDFPPK